MSLRLYSLIPIVHPGIPVSAKDCNYLLKFYHIYFPLSIPHKKRGGNRLFIKLYFDTVLILKFKRVNAARNIQLGDIIALANSGAIAHAIVKLARAAVTGYVYHT